MDKVIVSISLTNWADEVMPERRFITLDELAEAHKMLTSMWFRSSALAENSLQYLHTYLAKLMQTTYRLNASDLDEDFLKGLKTTFQGREIEIVVYDVVDETEYLMSSEANRERLLAAKKNIETRNNLVEVSR